MDDQQLFALCWKLLTAVVVVCILSITSCEIHKQVQINTLVEAGATPLEARCAQSGSISLLLCHLADGKE